MWNTKEDKLLVALWADGMKGPDIAKKLGRSRGSVMGRILRLRKTGIEFKARPPVKNGRRHRPKPLPKAISVARVKSSIPLPVAPVVEPEDPYRPPCDIMDLRFFSCRYIVSEKPTMYCNQIIHKHSYCEKHFKLCYQPGTNIPLTSKAKTTPHYMKR